MRINYVNEKENNNLNDPSTGSGQENGKGRHYFPDGARRTEEVKVRFTPGEMKLIQDVMREIESKDKLSTFLWRVVMSSIGRKRRELEREGKV